MTVIYITGVGRILSPRSFPSDIIFNRKEILGVESGVVMGLVEGYFRKSNVITKISNISYLAYYRPRI